MYEDKTKELILQEMLDATPADIDKRQGSITFDLSSPSAIQAALVYIELDNVLELGFADTSNGDFLAYRTGELGIYRKLALKSQGFLTFTGPEGQLIEKGTKCSIDSKIPIYFVVLSEGTIPASGILTLQAEAEFGGLIGNVGANTITLVQGNLSGVVSVTNNAAFDGGTDEESDESLLTRYYEKVQKPATSGNANHYLQWSKEIAGVSDAKVYPEWNGALSVKVILLDDEKTAPAQSVVDSVKTYIESVRPVGADVTVQAAVEVPINVSVTVTLASYATIQEVVDLLTNGLKAYLQELAFVDPLVRHTRIASIIGGIPPVIDYSNLLVNGGTANVEIADGSVAVLGTVTVV